MRIAIAAFIAALSSAAFPQQASSQVQPFPADTSVEQVIRGGLVTTFKDPESAQIKVTRGPRKATATAGSKTYSGWLACAQINAKNSYGAYTGFADYLVVIDPTTMSATTLPRITRGFENVDAWRGECFLKHDDDPPASAS